MKNLKKNLLKKNLKLSTGFQTFALAALWAAAASNRAQAASPAAEALSRALNGRTLVCDAAGFDPRVLTVEARGGGVEVGAKEKARGAVYSVDSATVRGGNVDVVLSDDIDGPLASVVLVLPITELRRLGQGDVETLKTSLFYREGYDGTHSRFAMTCHL